MVAVNVGMRTIYDSAYTERPNISEFIDAIDPRDIPLLALLGMGSEAATVSAGANSLAFPCLNTVHTWQNDQLVPSSGTLTASYTSGGLTLTVGSTQQPYAKAGDQIRVGTAHYEVATSSGTTWVVVLLDSATDSDHDNGTAWQNLGTLRLDGEAFQNKNVFISTDLSTTANFTQIFNEVVSVSGTSESIEKYGISGEFDREFAKKFEEMVIRLEQAAHYGLANSNPTVNTDRTNVRRMGGLYSFIRQGSGANVTDASSALLDEKTLVDLLQDIWDDGGKPDTILVGATQKRVLNSFATPYVRTDRAEDTLGIIVAKYESDFGDLDIVLDRYVDPTDLIVVQREFLGIGALAGNSNDRSFFVTPTPVAGDSREANITGEYTMEVRNSTRAHGWIHSLSTTLS